MRGARDLNLAPHLERLVKRAAHALHERRDARVPTEPPIDRIGSRCSVAPHVV
jgi:hypothetical protein